VKITSIYVYWFLSYTKKINSISSKYFFCVKIPVLLHFFPVSMKSTEKKIFTFGSTKYNPNLLCYQKPSSKWKIDAHLLIQKVMTDRNKITHHFKINAFIASLRIYNIYTCCYLLLDVLYKYILFYFYFFVSERTSLVERSVPIIYSLL